MPTAPRCRSPGHSCASAAARSASGTPAATATASASPAAMSARRRCRVRARRRYWDGRSTGRSRLPTARALRRECRRLLEFGILAEHRLLHPAQLWPWLDSQLTGQQAPRPAERAQRLALPPGPVEGQHELTVERLVIPMAGDQGLQFRDQVLSPAELEVGLDAPFHGEQVLVVEPCRGAAGERRIGDVGQRLAAPQGKRGRAGGPMLPHRRLARLRPCRPAQAARTGTHQRGPVRCSGCIPAAWSAGPLARRRRGEHGGGVRRRSPRCDWQSAVDRPPTGRRSAARWKRCFPRSGSDRQAAPAAWARPAEGFARRRRPRSGPERGTGGHRPPPCLHASTSRRSWPRGGHVAARRPATCLLSSLRSFVDGTGPCCFWSPQAGGAMTVAKQGRARLRGRVAVAGQSSAGGCPAGPGLLRRAPPQGEPPQADRPRQLRRSARRLALQCSP